MFVLWKPAHTRVAKIIGVALLALVPIALWIAHSTMTGTTPPPDGLPPAIGASHAPAPTASSSSTPTPEELLELLGRHNPELRFDSREKFRPVDITKFIDDPGAVLRRDGGKGAVIAATSGEPERLSLDFLGHDQYANGWPVQRNDRISLFPHYADAVAWLGRNSQGDPVTYARAVTGQDGLVVLEYEYFYLYNDAQPTEDGAPADQAGDREGDFEIVQVKLDANLRPTRVRSSQYQSAETAGWADVTHDGDRPVIYPAWGTHAGMYSSGKHLIHQPLPDENNGEGEQVVPQVQGLDDEPNLRWANWQGTVGGDNTPCVRPGWPGVINLTA
jgi:hypothetical protein